MLTSAPSRRTPAAVLGAVLATGLAALAAPSASAQHYDSWWKCVSSCCPECPGCVDACTEEFNAIQAASGKEYLSFYPSESIRLCPRCGKGGIKIAIKTRMYRGGIHNPDPAGIIGIQAGYADLDVARAAASWEEISWTPLPDFEFDPATGEWVCHFDLSVMGYEPNVIRAEALRDDGSVVPGAVNVVFGPGHWCMPDCDDSGSLDFFDFLCFQDRFATGDPRADCDGSGDLDFFDFLCFQNAFAGGCP